MNSMKQKKGRTISKKHRSLSPLRTQHFSEASDCLEIETNFSNFSDSENLTRIDGFHNNKYKN